MSDRNDPQGIPHGAPPVPRLTDSHAHLDDQRLRGDLAGVLARAVAAGVGRTVTVGTDLASSRAALELAAAHPRQLWATAGVHPHEAGKVADDDWGALEALWAAGEARAVGEIGLDYYYDFSAPPTQRDVFVRQLAAAGRLGLPVVVHVRDAYDDAFAVLEDAPLPAGGVLHCFSGGPAECERALALGLHVSFSGIVTFPRADAVREALSLTPADRLLVETDAPYLAPVPRRGRTNEPAYVVHTARRVAELRGCELEALAEQTTTNAERLFRLASDLQ